MPFESDGINTKEVFRGPTGQKLYDLVKRTIQEFQVIVAESDDVSKTSNSLMGYMANNSILFIQLIEMLTGQYKYGMADAYQHIGQEYDKKNG